MALPDKRLILLINIICIMYMWLTRYCASVLPSKIVALDISEIYAEKPDITGWQ